MKRAFLAIISTAWLGFFMVGCSGLQVVETNVTAFHNWTAAPPGPGTAYRFERLPSQQAVGGYQDGVEELTRIALAKVGMERSLAAPRFSVQVRVTTQASERQAYGPGYYDGFGFGSPGIFLGGGNRGAGFGLSFPLGMASPSPYFRRDVTLLVRDLASNQIVFESRALNDGVQSESPAVLPAMLDAALQGFPQPPPGSRRVTVQIPR
ncbi:MAG: hypothetical protein JWR74_2373 [Polaromonas sp.]|nr:hypothetical protein [Polaromonas sp.]